MRMIVPARKKNNDEGDVNVKNIRILITVNVVGSSGPMRFVENEDDKVTTIIDLTLNLYVRGGFLPVLGPEFKRFTLYALDAGTVAMNSSEEIGSCEGRNFTLYKKNNNQVPGQGLLHDNIVDVGRHVSYVQLTNRDILNYSTIRVPNLKMETNKTCLET